MPRFWLFSMTPTVIAGNIALSDIHFSAIPTIA